MKISTFFYNVGQGFKNIWRNKMFSMASIATMTACIFLFGVFYALGTNFSEMLHKAEEGVAVTVFFDEGLDEMQMVNIKSLVDTRSEVAYTNFVTAQQAWETFKAEYFEGNEEAAAGFADDNPLANSANIEIYLNDVAHQGELVAYLESLPGVRQVNKSEAAASTLSDINNLLTVLFMGIVILLLAVAIFLISNTIAVGISVRKEEIAIMKLIGAKDAFVRFPFVVEGVVIGLIGSLIPLGIIYVVYAKVIEYVENEFTFVSSMISFLPTEEIFRVLVPISMILGVGIGYIGSKITLFKHLRV